jgi:hypothetical protein
MAAETDRDAAGGGLLTAASWPGVDLVDPAVNRPAGADMPWTPRESGTGRLVPEPAGPGVGSLAASYPAHGGAGDGAPWWESRLAAALPLALAGGVFALAASHTMNVAAWAGQDGWRSWVIASTGELMMVAGALERRHRRRIPGSEQIAPVVVMVAAVGFSLATNLRSIGLDRARPGTWQQFMAAWPVVAFALVSTLKLTRPKAGHHNPSTVPGRPASGAEPSRARNGPAGGAAPDGAGDSRPVHPGIPPGRQPRPRSRDGGGRAVLARLVAQTPDAHSRPVAELAAELAPRAGLSVGTTRKYLGAMRNGHGVPAGDPGPSA